ncbi:MAG: hypothetical protein ACYCYO_01555 [Bacilli bacterium]
MMLWVWILILLATVSAFFSSVEFAVMISDNSDEQPKRTWKDTIRLWIVSCVMVLSIVGAVTFYHVQWTARYAQETAIMDARFGAGNVVNVLDQGASMTYQGWRDVAVILRGTPYDRTLKLRVNPANGGVMKW